MPQTTTQQVAAQVQPPQQIPQFAGLLPVGPVVKPPALEEARTGEGSSTVLRKNIFSFDDDAGCAGEEAWLDEHTIQELDDNVTDANRIFSRIAGVRNAIDAGSGWTRPRRRCSNSTWSLTKPSWSWRPGRKLSSLSRPTSSGSKESMRTYRGGTPSSLKLQLSTRAEDAARPVG